MWRLADFNENVAVLTPDGRRVSYADFGRFCERVAEAVGGRTLVFSLCENNIGSLSGYVGFLNAKVVPLMLSADIDRALLSRLTLIYKPDFFWVPQRRVDEFEFEEIFSENGYVLLKTPYRTEFELDANLALLLSTSGSTGDPKLVRQSYKNIESNTAAIVEYLRLDSSERAITTLPMNYTYGISILNTHLAAGATIILTDDSIMSRSFWNAARELGATSLGGVPYTYEMLDRLRFYRMELPELKTLTQAGGKLLPQLHKKFAQWASENGKNFVVMYGQTEATARMSYLPPEKSLEKNGSMGVAIPRGKFRLVGDDGSEIKTPDTVGELFYEGDNVAMGYAECGADLVKGDLWRGKLATGDMAKFDGDGYFYITGRKKRFLKIFGNRVNLDECERLLKSEFGTDCACTGVDDKMKIYFCDPAKTAEVLRFICEKTGLNKSAFLICTVPSIPKNSSGKILYTRLETL